MTAVLRAVPLGLRLMAASALCFSLMSLFVKLAGERLPTMEIVFGRSLIMTVVTFMLLRRAGLSPLGNHRRLLLVRGAVGVTSMSLLYFALSRIPLGDATAIFYMAPVWTALAAVFVLRERTAGLVVAGMGVSLTGVALIAKPSFLFGGLGALDGLAVAAALVAALLSGFVYAVVRKLRETDAPDVIILYLSAVGVVAALPFAGNWVWPVGAEWLWLLGAGATTQLGQIALTRGLHLERAGRAMSVGYLQVVFAFLLGALVFGTIPDLPSLLGATLIVASVLLVMRRSGTEQPSVRT